MYQHEIPGGRKPFLWRVQLRNFRSIARCSVNLRPLTLLVGRNGAGKSNFLDALAFVAEALGGSVTQALLRRGGIDEVRRRSKGHPKSFAIELALNLPGAQRAELGVEIGVRGRGGFVIAREQLSVVSSLGETLAAYTRREGRVLRSTLAVPPPVLADRLYLANAAGWPAFRPAYDALLTISRHRFEPEAMRRLQEPDGGLLLAEDGSNLACVVARLQSEAPEALERVRVFLHRIVPEIEDLEAVTVGPKETLQLRQRVHGSTDPWRFYASSLSDGTLRALAALVAVNQVRESEMPVRLVAVEEPEAALHPAASGALVEGLKEAAGRTQVLLTTHSPELLDRLNPDTDGLLVVAAHEGVTQIAPPPPTQLHAVREHLRSPGELLRADDLEQDRGDLDRQDQMDLFSPVR